MIDIKRKLKNFGPLEFLVISSLFYVVTMLIWTASTRASVLQKANDIKSNHKIIVEFMNDEINKCSSNEDNLTAWGENCNSLWNSSKIVKYLLEIFFPLRIDLKSSFLERLTILFFIKRLLIFFFL